MTQRLRPPHLFGKRTAPGDTPPYSGELLAVPAAPSPQPPVDVGDDLTILGFPAVTGRDDDDLSAGVVWPAGSAAEADEADEGALDAVVRLVTVHRADPVAALALMLAGAAAAASLWFPWVRGDSGTGLSLVRGSVAVAETGVGALSRSGSQWEPLVIVLGGVLLLPLGVLLFIPSRTHRAMGLVALLLTIAVTAGVLSRFAEAGWRWDGFDRGTWCAVAVSGLGLLGALKAMLRIPRVTLRARPTVPQ